MIVYNLISFLFTCFSTELKHKLTCPAFRLKSTTKIGSDNFLPAHFTVWTQPANRWEESCCRKRARSWKRRTSEEKKNSEQTDVYWWHFNVTPSGLHRVFIWLCFIQKLLCSGLNKTEDQCVCLDIGLDKDLHLPRFSKPICETKKHTASSQRKSYQITTPTTDMWHCGSN